MRTQPLVTAIIPTYNRAHLVPEAIDSVLAQTYPNVEIIVVDDGSTDDTQARLRQYGSKIRVITQDNAGPSAARNRGIAVGEGEVVTFLDSDDIWLPAKLERQMALLQKVDKSVPCCLCNIMMNWKTGKRASFEISLLNPSIQEGLWLNVDEVLMTRCVLLNQGVAIRREVLDRIGGFDESLWLLEDHELALRLSREGPWAFIREPLVVWRENIAGSLYQKGIKEQSGASRSMVRIMAKQVALIDGSKHTEQHRRMQRELKRAMSDLAAVEMSQMTSWGTSAIGHARRKIEHYRGAIFRRSPWYPKMKIEPVHGTKPAHKKIRGDEGLTLRSNLAGSRKLEIIALSGADHNPDVRHGKSHSKTRPRIAYLTRNDPNDRKSWSGTQHSMAKALQRHCGDVVAIGPIKPSFEIVRKAIRKGLKRLTGKTYLYTHTVGFSKQIARIASQKINSQKFDFVFAPAGSAEIAYLKTDLPLVYLSDATFASVLNYYPEFSQVMKGSIRDAHMVEQSAINRARLILYSSFWAAESARRDYGADAGKVRVLPFGANLEEPPDAERVLNKVSADGCRLLFVGVDWKKKGGKIAFETLLELERMGIPAQLTVVGCVPPDDIHHQDLRVVGSLNKNDSDQRRQLYQLYWDADFFLLPTRADCSPIALCEANAFGLPAITTDTGGIADIIENGKNGFRLPLSARGREYAEVIARAHSDKKKYSELRRNSRAAYDSRLNWDAWGIAVNKLVREVLGYAETETGAEAETTVAEAGPEGGTGLAWQPYAPAVAQKVVQGGKG